MQIMAGLDKPSTGEIWFNDKNVTGMKVQKRNVSMVYQQFINYPNFTVYENIASPLKITGVSSDEIKQRVGKVAELLKLSGMKLSQYPFQPTTEDLHRNGKNFPPNFLHKSWMDYLYWDVELES